MPPCTTLKTGVNLVFLISGTDCQGTVKKHNKREKVKKEEYKEQSEKRIS